MNINFINLIFLLIFGINLMSGPLYPTFNLETLEQPRLSEIFLKRHSGKAYDPDRYVTISQIKTMLEAARWAPSSHNDQPWNYIICDKLLTPEAYQKALNSFKETQKSWVVNAPVIVIAIARENLLHNNKPNLWAEYDTGASVLSLSLQAADLGLMVHQIGGFNKELIKKEFNIPDQFKPLTVMLVGYEAAEDPYPMPRDRRPLGENFFIGNWGVGFDQIPLTP